MSLLGATTGSVSPGCRCLVFTVKIQIFIIGKNVTEFTVRLICDGIGYSSSGMAVGANHSW